MCVCVCMCLRGSTRGRTSCGLVPLTEGGATVGTSSLTQREAEEEPQGEEEDGTEDPQAGKIVLKDADSATHVKASVRKKKHVSVHPHENL